MTGDPSRLCSRNGHRGGPRGAGAALGLDQPLYTQYVKFLGSALKGDFGSSFRYGEPALPLVLERLPASFELRPRPCCSRC
ncbi:hypothetical protein HMSSN036_30940 [Paenibacillus macerans]|nr:hypothetical protein HMSSN036_30940 [Paenibacillus macerans]